MAREFEKECEGTTLRCAYATGYHRAMLDTVGEDVVNQNIKNEIDRRCNC